MRYPTGAVDLTHSVISIAAPRSGLHPRGRSSSSVVEQTSAQFAQLATKCLGP